MNKIIICLLLFTTTLFSLENTVLFCGNSNQSLGKQVASELEMELGKAVVSKFNDGEVRIRLFDNVRNKDVFVIQSTCANDKQSVNDSIMELFLMIRTLKRASVNSITVVIPYFGYARQDRKVEPRVPISAADVAMLIEDAGADRVVSVDLHAGQIQGFFRNVPVDNLYASVLFAPYYAEKGLQDVVVVSPDAGGVQRAKQFAEKLKSYGVQSSMAMMIKQRKEAGVVETMNLVGDVSGKVAIIIDDLCDTAGTLVKAAENLKEFGATHVYAAITHPVFSPPALERIAHSVIDEVVITDTIDLSSEAPENIKQVSVAPLIAETIKRIQNGESVSSLF